MPLPQWTREPCFQITHKGLCQLILLKTSWQREDEWGKIRMSTSSHDLNFKDRVKTCTLEFQSRLLNEQQRNSSHPLDPFLPCPSHAASLTWEGLEPQGCCASHYAADCWLSQVKLTMRLLCLRYRTICFSQVMQGMAGFLDLGHESDGT